MSMSALVRALGAAAGGVSKGMDEAEAAAERKRKREQDAEDRAFTMSERARKTAENERADKLRVDMGVASAPVNVEQVQPAGPVMDGAEGAAGQAIPMVSRVLGKSFETPDAAAAAATAASDPMAVAERQAQVAASAGDPHAAQQLRTGAMQEKAAKLQLSGAERTELDAQFNADLQSKVNSWETLDKFISDSAGDGQGGAAKYTSVPSPDGKTRVLNRIGPDGAMVPTGQAFPNTADGLQLAMGELSKLSPEKKLMHLHQKEQARRAAEAQAATAGHQANTLAEQIRHNKAVEAAYGVRARAGGGAGGDVTAGTQQPAGINMAEVDKFINPFFTTGGADAGSTAFNPEGALAVRGLAPRMPAALNGDSQGAANQAMALYMAELKKAGGDHNKAMAAINKKADDIAARAAPQVAKADSPGAKPAKPAAAPAAPETPVERAKQAPVVDFSAGGSAVQKRMAKAVAEIPALEQSVMAAQQKVQDAASRGPMAVAAARNDLSNAKTALAEMLARAGR